MRISPISVPIFPRVTNGELWPKSQAKVCCSLDTREFVPRLRVASDVLSEIKRKARGSSADSGVLMGYQQDGMTFHIEDLLWNEPSTGELSIPLHAHRLPFTSSQLLDSSLRALPIGHGKHSPAQPTDYFLFLSCYTHDPSGLQLSIQLTYPRCAFELRKLDKRLKVVSCPLSHELCVQSDTFKSGFLTMDQNHRLLPILAGDSAAVSYPLVGIWVAGATV